jgi:hypothetical protein
MEDVMARDWRHWMAALAACALLVPAMAQAPERPSLPAFPATPAVDDQPYPECRYAYRERNLARSRAEDAAECIEQIDAYYVEVLAPFPARMTAHQQAIAELRDRVTNDSAGYDQGEASDFIADLTAEFEASNSDGPHYTAYLAGETRYRDDRDFLGERFCRYAECEGYEPNAVTGERDEADGMQQCGEPGDTIYLEGLIGIFVNRVRRLNTGTNITGSMIDFACRLRPEERQMADAASEQVVAQEEVGATAEWVSPSRAEVSGSSTVTAMNSQPTGATCLDITDVIIIDGEEARRTKTMCRAPGETRYTLQA